jgi:hypothetical protein
MILQLTRGSRLVPRTLSCTARMVSSRQAPGMLSIANGQGMHAVFFHGAEDVPAACQASIWTIQPLCRRTVTC